jgi:hypothetical protein
MLTSPRPSRSRFFIVCALLITVALVFGSFLPLGVTVRAQRSAQARMGNPRPGAPEGDFPNLNEVKRRPQETPVPRPEIPSSIRSKRNPLEPWNKRFPLPLPQIEEREIGELLRETKFRNITGDHGHGHGVFQFDDRT